MTAPVAVLGAGIAGLVAARELHRNGYDVRVFEAGPKVAGLATTHRDEDGFMYDVGAHFITNRLAAAIGVSSQCRLVHYYGESVLLDGRYASYPTGLMKRPKFITSALKARLHPPTHREESAETWFNAEYGEALAHEVALPLLEAWSGVPAAELAASVGNKMPASIIETAFLIGMARATNRAVSVGYCWAKPQSAAVWHVYPEHGVSTLCEHLANELPDVISVNSPVEGIMVERDKVVAVKVKGDEIPVSAVISTAPVNVLPKLVRGTEALEKFRRFRYRPMVFVNLKLRGQHLLPDVVVWLPTGFPFFRLTEAPRSMPWLAPEGKTMVLCDIGAVIGDEHWTMDDEQLSQVCLGHLQRLIPDIHDRFLGCNVIRTPLGYPVYLREYEMDRVGLATSTGVDGLISVGRHGEFSHNLMEDVYWLTIDRVHSWMRANRQCGS